MKRRFRLLFVLLTLVGSLAPAQGNAGALRPTITAVDPSQIVAGAPDTGIAITGEGFVDREPGRARLTSRVWAAGMGFARYLESSVVDTQRIDAIIPAEMLTEAGSVSLMVHTFAGTASTDLVRLTSSNEAIVDVVPIPPKPLAALEVTTESPENVDSCIDASIRGIDEDGNRVDTSDLRVSLTSDDPNTPAAQDGAATFSDYCGGDPVGGITLDSYGGYFSARVTTPGDVDLIATVESSTVSGRSGPIRVAGGYISGRVVRRSDGAPMAGVAVTRGFVPPPQFIPVEQAGAAPSSANDFDVSDSLAVTDDEGRFTTRAMGPGEYALLFVPPPESGLVRQWLGDTFDENEAQNVTLTDGATIDVAQTSLPEGGTLSGVVTAEDTGAPLEACVNVFAAGRPDESVDGTCTADDGTYRSSPLPAGAYTVLAGPRDSDYRNAWYGGTEDQASAQPADVSVGVDTANVDIAAKAGVGFEGVLTDRDNAAPLEGIVHVFSQASGRRVASSEVGPDGAFRTSPGLPPGSYKLLATSTNPVYVDSWNGDAASFKDAPVIESASGRQHADLTVPLGGRIKGTVLLRGRVSGGMALPGIGQYVTVAVVDSDGHSVATARTDGRGSYETSGLVPGAYTLQFLPPGPYAPEWYGDAGDRAEATTITVGLGEEAIANEVLELGARIEGVVVAADPGFSRVVAWDETGPVREGSVNEDGTFGIDGLAAGRYKLELQACCGESTPGWYPNAATRGTAAEIEVPRGQTVTGKNIVAGAPAYIEGALTAAGEDAAWGEVQILDPVTHDVIQWIYGDEGGHYKSEPLHDGSYLVRFDACCVLAPQFFGGTGSSATATPVEVAAGSVRSGIDARFEPGQAIKGTVSAVHSNALVPETPYKVTDALTGDIVQWSYAWNGDFTTRALAPGTYKIEVDDWSNRWSPRCGHFFSYCERFDPVFAPSWFDGKPSFETADPIVVTSGADTTGVDAHLSLRD